MKIIGNIVVQEGMPDILRAVESLASFCDSILVVDGGSKDGTREFLYDRKDIYNMEVFFRKFDGLLNQRNFLLEKCALNEWVAVLDHDECFSPHLQRNIRRYLEQYPYDLYARPTKDTPLTMSLKYFQLKNDLHHYIGEPFYHQNRLFYYDEGLKWRGATHDAEHTILSYDNTEYMSALQPVKGFGVLHYAELDPKRKEWRKKQKGTKLDSYSKNLDWDDTSIYPLPDEYI